MSKQCVCGNMNKEEAINCEVCGMYLGYYEIHPPVTGIDSIDIRTPTHPKYWIKIIEEEDVER